MIAQVGRDQQAGNIVGQHVEHPLGILFGAVVVAESHIRPRQVSIDGRIVRVVLVQIFRLVPGPDKLMLVEQELYLRLAQLKILRSQAEPGGDGFSGLAVVVRRSGLVRPADQGRSKIVIGFSALGMGCDLLPGGGDSLFGWSGLLGLSIAQCSQEKGCRDKKMCLMELHHVPSKKPLCEGSGTPGSVRRNLCRLAGR